MQIKRFVQKPPIIHVVQYDIANGREIQNWTNGRFVECEVLEPTENNPSGAFLYDKRSNVRAMPGDWIYKSGDFSDVVGEDWLFNNHYLLQEDPRPDLHGIGIETRA